MGSWLVGLWVEMGVGLHVCGFVVAMHVFAKVGGGYLGKKVSLSLSQASPPLICCCLLAYKRVAKGVQIAFKGRLARLWVLRVRRPERGKRALN